MKAVIRLELIADDYFWRDRNNAWHGFDEKLYYMRKLGYDKSPSGVYWLLPDGETQQMRGTRDYSQANATGSRGIFEYYPLRDGVYLVVNRYKLNKVNRYYIRVDGETITEISREEADECRKQQRSIRNTSA